MNKQNAPSSAAAHHDSKFGDVSLAQGLAGVQLVPPGRLNAGDFAEAAGSTDRHSIGRPGGGEAHARPHLQAVGRPCWSSRCDTDAQGPRQSKMLHLYVGMMCLITP